MPKTIGNQIVDDKMLSRVMADLAKRGHAKRKKELGKKGYSERMKLVRAGKKLSTG